MFRGLLIVVTLFIIGFAVKPQAQELPNYTLTETQIKTLETGAPISEISKAPDGHVDVFGIIDIKSSPEKIWVIMKDCPQQLDIIPDLKACNVLEESPDALWDKREQIIRLGFPLPNVRSEFRSDYAPFQTIKITRTGGDLSVLNGEWTLTPLTPKTTRVSYRARMKSRLPVPRRFIRKSVDRDMPIILKNLKSAAEANTARRQD